MNIKIVLLMVLAASILLLGCAGKARQDATEQPPEISAPADSADEPASQPSGEPEKPAEEPAENASGDEGALADLFRIDTDKPISDEGFDVSTPSSD